MQGSPGTPDSGLDQHPGAHRRLKVLASAILLIAAVLLGWFAFQLYLAALV